MCPRDPDDGPLLALGAGAPPLPPVGHVPPCLRTHGLATERMLAPLLIPLARAGLLRAPSSDPSENCAPSTLLGESWRRHVQRSGRRAPGALDIHLCIQPLVQVLPDAAAAAGVGRLAITIDAGLCVVVALSSVRERWGDLAAGVIATALRKGLGRVLHVWDPDDLEWVAEWWIERLECFDDNPAEMAFEVERIAEFNGIREQLRRSYASIRSRAELREALRALPEGPVRRSAAALLTDSRSTRAHLPSATLDRCRFGTGHPSAAVLLTNESNDVVRHAYDEVQDDAANGGHLAPPHAVVLLDTRSPARLAASAREVQRVLRTLSWGERLVHAIREP